MDSNRNGASSIRGFNSAAAELNDDKCIFCCLMPRESVEQIACGHRCCDCMMRRNDPRCPIDNELLIGAEQAIGDQHSDAGLPTEESQYTTQTQQLVIPIQEQHSHLQPSFCGAGTSGIFHHVREERAARPCYQCGYHQLPDQRDDDNLASGWSGSFAGIRQAGGLTSPQVGQVRNILNAPVEEEGSNHGYHYGNVLQNSLRMTSTQQKEQITENCCGRQELQQLSNETRRRLCLFDEAIMSQIEAKMCRGTYQWKIKHFQQCRRDAITGAMSAQFSPAIYTSSDGYTFCIRMHLNGVNSGIGTHVAIFVHMMQGECDNRLAWPFTGVITLSILDQSAAKDPKDVTQMLVASPKLMAFRKPTAKYSEIGCGFEMFAPIDQICAEPFVQNNTMLVKIQIQSFLS